MTSSSVTAATSTAAETEDSDSIKPAPAQPVQSAQPAHPAHTAQPPHSYSATAAAKPLWTRSFVAGTLLNFFIAGNYFMLMVIMTAYALTVYQAPPAAAAFCASAFIVGTLFSRFAAAPIMDRIGRIPLLVVSCVAEVGLTALYLLNGPISALICVRLIHGFAYGLCSTTIATVITGLVPAERKGEGIGYFMLSITLGSAIGPFAGIFLANNFGYPILFIVACIIVAAAIPAALLLRPPASTKVRGKKNVAQEEIAAAEDAEAGVLAAAPEEERREEQAADALVSQPHEPSAAASAAPGASADVPMPPKTEVPQEHCHRIPSTRLEAKISDKVEHSPAARFIEAGVLPIALVCGLLYFGYSSLLTFLTPYATEIGLAKAASVFFVVYALAMFVTRPFTGRAFDRKGPHLVMVPSFIAFSCGMVLLAFSHNDLMLLGSAIPLGFGVGTVQSCGLAMAVRVVSDARLSVANATFYMLLDVGVGIGPILLGIVAPLTGYSNLYLCMAVVGLLALALFFVVARTEKQES